MKHNYLNNDTSGDHWAVSWTGPLPANQDEQVLVQLQRNGEQIRVPLTADQADAMAEALKDHAAQVRKAKQ